MEDVEIRARLETLARALRSKDIDALMSHYSSDVVVFDLPMALQCRGADAYRKNFESWFAMVRGPIGYEVHELRVAARGEVAFCHHLARVRTIRKQAGYWAEYWVRVTSGWRKAHGEWKVARGPSCNTFKVLREG